MCKKSFEGFVPKADSSTSITLKADSAQNVADIYYTRSQYMLTFKLGDGVTLDEAAPPTTEASITAQRFLRT